MNQNISKTGKRAVFIALCINLLTGAQYCWSMMGSTLMEEHGWTITQTSLPYSVLFVTASLWSVVVGTLVDRFGPNHLIRIGAISNCLGLVIAGNSGNWWLVLFSVGILMGLASGSLSNSTSPTAIKFVPLRYKGLVTGIVSAGIGWTSLYMAPLINRLLSLTTVGMTFTIVGVFNGVLLFVLSFFLPNPVLCQNKMNHNNSQSEQENIPGIKEHDLSKYKDKVTTTGQAVRTRETWILFFMFTCSSMAGLVFTSQVTNIAKVQAGIQNGYILVMVMGVANGLGRLLIPAFSDKLGIVRTWLLIYLITAADLVLILFSSNMESMIFAVFLMSFFYGGGIPLMWATVTDVFGKRYMSTVFGIVTNGYAVSSVFGPMLAAGIVERTGSYLPMFLTLIAITMTGAVLTLYLSKERKS